MNSVRIMSACVLCFHTWEQQQQKELGRCRNIFYICFSVRAMTIRLHVLLWFLMCWFLHLLNYQRHLLIVSCASVDCCFYKVTLYLTPTEFNWHELLNIFVNFTFGIETGCLIPMSYWCDKTWFKVKSKEHQSCTEFPVAMLYYHSVLYYMFRWIYKHQNLSSCFSWK